MEDYALLANLRLHARRMAARGHKLAGLLEVNAPRAAFERVARRLVARLIEISGEQAQPGAGGGAK